MITARTLLRAGLAMFVFMALVAVGGTAAAQAGVLGAESTAAGGPSSGPSASPQPYPQEPEKGAKGDKGSRGDKGKDGDDGKDGRNGKDGKNGRNGSNASSGSTGRTGQIVGSYDVDLDPPASNDGFSQIGSDDVPYGSVATG